MNEIYKIIDNTTKNELCFPKSHDDIIELLHQYIEKKQFPNILFYGDKMVGKKTILLYYLKKLFNEEKIDDLKRRIKKNEIIYYDCNQHKNQGIQFIRDNIIHYAKQINNFNNNYSNFKCIILNNADKLSQDSQYCLRRVIEIYSKYTRFYFITTNINKIVEPIISRFFVQYIPNPIINHKLINFNDIHKDNYSIELNNVINTTIQNTIDKLFIDNINLNNDNILEIVKKITKYSVSSLDIYNYIINNILDKNSNKENINKFKINYYTKCSTIKDETLLLIYLISQYKLLFT